MHICSICFIFIYGITWRYMFVTPPYVDVMFFLKINILFSFLHNKLTAKQIGLSVIFWFHFAGHVLNNHKDSSLFKNFRINLMVKYCTIQKWYFKNYVRSTPICQVVPDHFNILHKILLSGYLLYSFQGTVNISANLSWQKLAKNGNLNLWIKRLKRLYRYIQHICSLLEFYKYFWTIKLS